MKWKYHIPHIWEQSTTDCEDVWLLPDDPAYNGDSIWLTVQTLGPLLLHCVNEEEEHYLQDCQVKMREKSYLITNGEMIVPGDMFTMPELLDWVRIWLRDKGLQTDELIAAPYEDFVGTNKQALVIGVVTRKTP